MRLSRTNAVVLGLGFTQIVGWGTTYLMPSVLGRHIQADLGLSAEMVFAGITVMSAVAAIFAPRIGRFVDRRGACLVMTVGSLLYGLALATLSQSQGVASYFAGWVTIGAASALALSTPSAIAITQVAGPRARQAIAMLTIIGGFASTLFWPVTGVLDAAFGWRTTLLLFAALHVVACAPTHFLILPRTPPPHPATEATAPTGETSSRNRARIFLLLAITLSFGAFVFSGVQVQMIELLRGLGHTPASALLLASLIGPAQVGIRIFELLFGHRYPIMKSAVFGSVMLPLGLALAIAAGDVFAVALVAVLAYGMSNGLKAVQRATLPLALFGRARFGAYMGWLALPQGIVSAASPPVMAAVMSQWGTAAALWLAFAAAAISLVAMILLARLATAAR